MKSKFSILLGIIAIAGFSCRESGQKKSLTFADCPVVAQCISNNGDSLIVCDIEQVKDTFNIPLSSLLSSFEVIRLENAEDALTAVDGAVAISDNYIGIASFKAKAYKLYDKKGNYLRTLSKPGQGPDEYYISIYDSYIDEKNRKVYLISGRATKLMVFDLEGNALEHIPLPYVTHKGRFIIYPEKEMLTMMVLPFLDTPSVIWEQDFKGNVHQEIPSGQFVIKPSDYSNEIWESLNTCKIDFSLVYWLPTRDTLYHYQPENNRLQPRFTLHFNEEVIRHNYIELPNHYLVWLIDQAAWSEMPRFSKILVDKKTMRGCYVDFKLDMLGNIDGPNKISFSRGYFTAIMDSYALKEQLEKALSQPDKLNPEMLKKIKDLNNSITEDDNNIVFIGKLKDRYR